MNLKRIGLLLIVIILAGVAFYLYKNKSIDKNKSYDFSYRDFPVENIDDIGTIMLYRRDGNTIKLSKQGENWSVNDNYPADKMMVRNLISVIKNIRIEYVPPESSNENILKEMAYGGIKTEIFDKNGNLLKSYYVGGSPQNSVGTYFVMTGSGSPLVMSMPGFNGNLKVRFSYTEDEWRDKTVFAIQPENIQEIKMHYLISENESFLLKRTDNGFIISDIAKKSPDIKINSEYADTYLLGYKEKGCEYIENTMLEKDEVLSKAPIVELDIKLKAGTNKNLKIYMLPRLEEEIQDDKQGIDKYLNQNILRYIAQNEKGDLFLIQYEVFQDLFVRKNWFFKN